MSRGESAAGLSEGGSGNNQAMQNQERQGWVIRPQTHWQPECEGKILLTF